MPKLILWRSAQNLTKRTRLQGYKLYSTQKITDKDIKMLKLVDSGEENIEVHVRVNMTRPKDNVLVGNLVFTFVEQELVEQNQARIDRKLDSE